MVWAEDKLWIKDPLKKVELFCWICLQFVSDFCQVQREVQQDQTSSSTHIRLNKYLY